MPIKQKAQRSQAGRSAPRDQQERKNCRKGVQQFVDEVWEIERHEAKSVGKLGFMARSLAIATMPHRSVSGCEFRRTNGEYTLCMLADPEIGLPYGSIPRVLIAWLTTEVIRTKEREICLGPSLSAFLRELGMNSSTGGKNGNATSVRKQMLRLFSCSIHGFWQGQGRFQIRNYAVVEEANLWWDPKSPCQNALWQSNVTLGDRFFREIIEHPIPIDLRAIKALNRSPLAVDIYIWLTHRVSYLREETRIPWAALQTQFGAGYATNPQGIRNFRRAFKRELKKVLVVFRPKPNVREDHEILAIGPSRPHVPRTVVRPTQSDDLPLVLAESCTALRRMAHAGFA